MRRAFAQTDTNRPADQTMSAGFLRAQRSFFATYPPFLPVCLTLCAHIRIIIQEYLVLYFDELWRDHIWLEIRIKFI